MSEGVQGFSKPVEHLALWAADTMHKPHEVRAYLSAQQIWFIPCLGSYKGQTEMAYLTKESDFWTVADKLCPGQESVLILGDMDSRSRRKATLLYLREPLEIVNTFRSDELGRMYSIPAAEISEHDGWTIPLQQPPMGEVLAYVCAHTDKFGEPIN